jgi:hypothetical protein
MARIKVANRRTTIRQSAFTSVEDLDLTAAAKKVMLTRSSFIRWAVLKQTREVLNPQMDQREPRQRVATADAGLLVE